MKRSPQYTLKEIANVPYLLPFGQNIATHRKGVKLNATGVFIWNALAQEPDRIELLALIAENFQVDALNREELERDMNSFLDQLQHLGIILPDFPDQNPMEHSLSCYLRIGGLILHYLGAKDLFSPEFEPFVIKEPDTLTKPDQKIRILLSKPSHDTVRRVLLHNEELILSETEDYYLIQFPSTPRLTEAHLAKDGSHCDFYCIPPFDTELQQALFHGIRFTYLLLAQRKGMFMIHSSSVLYRDKAWLFSGVSGTGKSTHAGLWNKYLGVPILNGDLNLMELTSNGPVIHGIPWCGTSQISTVETYPLGGIVLLKQHPSNLCENLETDRKILLVSQRFISPAWTEEMLEQNLNFAKELAQKASVFRLLCTPEREALDTIQGEIDKCLDTPY
ncbi:MAG: PqqD family peptide modification chaperone [Lachnospiraceae bacterium]|nr:PqqD family peptide modification chaperone [Lachnospiraceae bacterium]